ncbi:DUF7285 family protein [Methanooceanicella nereidis]|uniref:DUF7285 family protein n=1 Tax=Methanooceanicella nereidis TaxID=2052831 RepID=UPI001E3E859B|nr:hypothetical protein [Methanocella sp. CWC-04]
MFSLVRDDSAMTGPYTDIPAVSMVAIGMILFCYIVMMAYSSYMSGVYYATTKDDIRAIASIVLHDPAIAFEGHPGVLDAVRMDGVKDHFYPGIGYPGSTVTAVINAGEYSWEFGKEAKGKSISYMLPVSVRLNEARCIPGTLTVTMWEEG